MSMNGSDAEYSTRVHRAESIVSGQADCTFAEALAKLKERAKALSQTLDDIATGVVGHRICFR